MGVIVMSDNVYRARDRHSHWWPEKDAGEGDLLLLMGTSLQGATKPGAHNMLPPLPPFCALPHFLLAGDCFC